MTVMPHIIMSISVGTAVGIFSRSFSVGLVCFLSGLLLDVDHIIEYVINFGWKDFTLKAFYETCRRTAKQEGEPRFKQVHLIFHSLELAFILWLAVFYTKNMYVFAATLGYSVHLILDCLGGERGIDFLFYFIGWRATKKFRASQLIRKKLCRAGGCKCK